LEDGQVTLIFRKIKKNRWYWDTDSVEKTADDFPADVFCDLQTRNNTLSVYLVDQDESNLDRVIAAFAANGDRPDVLDFALVQVERLSASSGK
jgi:hypothetical protein